MLRRWWHRLIGAYFRRLDRLIKKRAHLPPGATWSSDVFPWLTPLGDSAPQMREELERYIAAGGVLPDKEELSPGRTAQYGLERW